MLKYRRNECPECKINPRPGQRTCRACHAKYMRELRKRQIVITKPK